MTYLKYGTERTIKRVNVSKQEEGNEYINAVLQGQVVPQNFGSQDAWAIIADDVSVDGDDGDIFVVNAGSIRRLRIS